MDNKKLLLRSNYVQAMARLKEAERKLKRNSALQKEYQETLQNYKALGTSEQCPFEEITPKDDSPIYFVLHHVVIRPERETTKHQVA